MNENSNNIIEEALDTLESPDNETVVETAENETTEETIKTATEKLEKREEK